jgi:hypothetical protein
MADNGFGGWTDFQGGVAQQKSKQPSNPYAKASNPNNAWWTRQQQGIKERKDATAAREAREKFLDENSLVNKEKYAESQQEGDIAFGRIGRNYPGDTRAAQTLKALGVNPDFMSAIIASAQLPPWGNR